MPPADEQVQETAHRTAGNQPAGAVARGNHFGSAAVLLGVGLSAGRRTSATV